MRQILCVEDNEDSRELVKLALETRFPYVCVSLAGSIDEARELTESNNYDLYILDNWLPGGSGVDLCRLLREGGSAAPILFFFRGRTRAQQIGRDGCRGDGLPC